MEGKSKYDRREPMAAGGRLPPITKHIRLNSVGLVRFPCSLARTAGGHSFLEPSQRNLRRTRQVNRRSGRNQLRSWAVGPSMIEPPAWPARGTAPEHQHQNAR